MAAAAPPSLILASSSPQRSALLRERGYEFSVVTPPDPEPCGLCSGESAPEFVSRVALHKARGAAKLVDRGVLIACDTVAEWGGQILGKPADEAHARRMLETLRGRRHHVYSGLCVWSLPRGEPRVQAAKTILEMDDLGDEALDEYLLSGEWEGKAGAFGYQDRTGWLSIVSGSESNVIGLPLELLEEMLAEVGFARRAG